MTELLFLVEISFQVNCKNVNIFIGLLFLGHKHLKYNFSIYMTII